jgi:hypothetical protein
VRTMGKVDIQKRGLRIGNSGQHNQERANDGFHEHEMI